MPKEERNDPLFKGFLLKDAPGASVRKPRDNVLVCGIRQNHVKLHRKGGFLVSSAWIDELGRNLGKIAVRALSIIAFVDNELAGLGFFPVHQGDFLRITTGLVVVLALGRRLFGGSWRSNIVRRGCCCCESIHCEEGRRIGRRRTEAKEVVSEEVKLNSYSTLCDGVMESSLLSYSFCRCFLRKARRKKEASCLFR